MKTIHFVRGYAWPPSLFNQPRGNSLGARLNFIMIPLKMAERSSISCDPSRYRNRVDIRYALFQNSQGKSALYFIRFISTEKWVGCKHFKSYIFEVFADKHGQVAGDSMTRSRRSSGGSRLLMKALVLSRFRKESIAFMRDIEAMFHQVRVDESHRDLL